MPRLRRALLLGLAAWALAAFTLDQLGRRPTPEGPFDAIIVAGCRVTPEGEASVPLRARTELAVSLYEQGLAKRILFTGGVGEHPPSEAEAAYAVARELGVPARHLMLEERSTSTEENARNAAELLDADRVLLVTDAYHVVRAERVFARHLPEVVGVGSVAPLSYRAKGALREVAALGWYAATDRL
ncbi:MAG: YdcF family protein [Alphaproteobacteria bacterium]|nr:YdcF family protein [Alphaproteobacteria bacterium]